MPRPTELHVVRRKRGNPNWGRWRPDKVFPAMATEFEMQFRELRLTPEMYLTLRKLKNWCERNRNRCYIPEWLLKAWNISVNPYVGTAA